MARTEPTPTSVLTEAQRRAMWMLADAVRIGWRPGGPLRCSPAENGEPLRIATMRALARRGLVEVVHEPDPGQYPREYRLTIDGQIWLRDNEGF